MRDHDAHMRIDKVEEQLKSHFSQIGKLETAIKENTVEMVENTKLTREVAANTSALSADTKELIELYKTGKGMVTKTSKFATWTRKFIFNASIFIAAVVGAIVAVKTWLGR